MDEAVRLWSHVLAKDVGIAPCVDDGILTLCTCKPRIRAGAEIGDRVLATLPERFGSGRVARMGRVAEAIDVVVFAERWPDRADALYERKPDGRLVHRGGAYHAEPELIARDPSVRRCLRFDPFWYFGGEGPTLPESLLDLRHYFVGQSTRMLDRPTLRELERWLAAWPPAVHGEPREAAEGARWRAGMPWLRGADPGSSNLRGGGGPDGSGRPSCGQGSGRGVGGRTARPRSCREPAVGVSADPPAGGDRSSGRSVRSRRSMGPAVSAEGIAPCCRQGRASPEGGGAFSSQAERSRKISSRPRSRSIKWRPSG